MKKEEKSEIPKKEEKVATYVPKTKKKTQPRKKVKEVKVVLVKPSSLIVLLGGHNQKIPMKNVVGGIENTSIGDIVKIRL